MTSKLKSMRELSEFRKDVRNCARCGTTHDGLLFKQLANYEENLPWSHFSMCPRTNQPILFGFFPSSDETEEE